MIFPSPPSYIQLYKTATSVSTKASRSSRGFSLKLSLAYLEMDESTLLTQGDHAVTGGVEVSPR